MRSPKRGAALARRRQWQGSCGMDPISLQELSFVKGREDAREALSEHGLARARRPRQEEVMTTGGGDLDGETPHRLAPALRESSGPARPCPHARSAVAVPGTPRACAGPGETVLKSGQAIRPDSASTSSRSDRAVRTTGLPTSKAP